MSFKGKFGFVFGCSLFTALLTAVPPPATIDPTFNTGSGPNAPVWAITLQPDGKILVGGNFNRFNEVPVNGLVRLNSDGSVDSSFNGNASRNFVINPASNFKEIQSILIQADGRILVGSLILRHAARFELDGSLDETFRPTGTDGEAGAYLLDHRGNLLVGGELGGISHEPLFPRGSQLLRLFPNGELDNTYRPLLPIPRGTDLNLAGGLGFQSTGKLIASGALRGTTSSISLAGVVRVLENGSFDSSFQPSGFRRRIYTRNHCMSIQSDDFILIGSDYSIESNEARVKLFRLRPDGALDATFSPIFGPIVARPPTYEITTLALQPDGKILAGGSFTTLNNLPVPGLVRLNADGSHDASFEADRGATALAVQPNGRILVGGPSSLVRLMGGGGPPEPPRVSSSLDVTATAEQTVTFRVGASGSAPLELQWWFNNGPIPSATNSQIILTNLTLAHAGSYSVTVRNPVGIVTNTPAILTVTTPTLPEIRTNLVNKTIREGQAASFSVVATNSLPLSYQWRFNGKNLIGQTNSTLLIEQATAADGGVYSVVIRTELRSVTSAEAVLTIEPPIVRTGSVDLAFRPPPVIDTRGLRSLAVQPDDQVLVLTTNYVVRLRVDGSLDPGFASIKFTGGKGLPVGGLQRNTTQLVCLDLLSDGRIMIGGRFSAAGGQYRGSIACLNPDGTLNPTFPLPIGVTDTNSIDTRESVSTLAGLPDGKVLVGGSFLYIQGWDWAGNSLVRLNRDGTPDKTFEIGTGPSYFYVFGSMMKAVLPTPDGKVFVAGNFSEFNGVPRTELALLEANGSVNPDFNTDGTFLRGPSQGDTVINDMLLLPDGKVLIVGGFTRLYGVPMNRIARLNPDGRTDSTFNPGTGAGGTINGIARQPNGKLIIVGDFPSYNGTLRRRVARLEANGSLDLSFDPGAGPNGAVTAVALQSDGKIVIRGPFTEVDGIRRLGIARLHGRHPLAPEITAFGVAGNTFTLSFSTLTGRTYVVETTSELVRGTWTEFDRVAGDGSIQTVRPASIVPIQSFYRVRVEGP